MEAVKAAALAKIAEVKARIEALRPGITPATPSQPMTALPRPPSNVSHFPPSSRHIPPVPSSTSASASSQSRSYVMPSAEEIAKKVAEAKAKLLGKKEVTPVAGRGNLTELHPDLVLLENGQLGFKEIKPTGGKGKAPIFATVQVWVVH